MKEMKVNKVEDYFSTKETSFFHLLKNTKKWKELYNQKESILAMILALLFTVFLVGICMVTPFEKFNELLLQVLYLIISAATGMLGFIISGLAIFTGTITNRLVKNIDADDKITALVGILFSFYFIGAFIGISIFIYFLGYILLLSELTFYFECFLMLTVIIAYLFSFSILYSVSLLGTCIRLFFVSYKYSSESKDDER